MNLGQSFSRRIRRLLGACLVLTIVMVGCATPATPKIAQGEMPPSGGDHLAQPTVQVLPTQTASLEGQTSWIIQPASTRIPKIAGLNGQLPPHIEQRLSYAFDLAQRGATYTADAEFRAVLGLCALEIDARDGGTNHREAMRQGLIALDEADQFCGDQMNWRDSADVRRVAAGHTTRILSQAPSPVDSIQAVQAYYAFAEQRLAYACDGLPEASMAYYGLARTIGVPGLRIENASGKAALLHRVALLVAPRICSRPMNWVCCSPNMGGSTTPSNSFSNVWRRIPHRKTGGTWPRCTRGRVTNRPAEPRRHPPMRWRSIHRGNRPPAPRRRHTPTESIPAAAPTRPQTTAARLRDPMRRRCRTPVSVSR